MRRFAIAVVKEGAEFWAFLPDLPGVYGRGATVGEAEADARDALSDYLDFLREQGEPQPSPSTDAVEIRYADVSA